MTAGNLLFAYLDPGAGSVVLQVLIGGILGGVLMLKLFWRRLVNFFTGKRQAGADEGAPPGPPSP